MSTEPLFMLRLRLEIPGLIGIARRQRLPVRDVDLGYVAHAALGELFGKDCPKPFVVQERRSRWATVLAYSNRPAEALRGIASACSDPAVYRACDWEHFDEKPMPREWPPATRFAFETRVCPIVRMNSDGARHRKGAEVDAFLAECWRVGDTGIPVDRERVYLDWLGKRLEAGGARVLRAGLERFSRERLLRRTHEAKRKSRLCERPDATLSGVLEVEDGARITALLRRGLGRHRAFGFGMLLLRHAGR